MVVQKDMPGLMRHRRSMIFAAVILVAAAIGDGRLWADDVDTTPAKLSGHALIDALRRGGYILFLRHGSTIDDQKDTDRDHLDNCSKQRNLSDRGRAGARAVGEAFRVLRIPVGDVRSSPYCRCIDTATLAFGRVEKDAKLALSVGASKRERDDLVRALQDKLTAAPAAGQDTVLTGHTANLKAAAGVWPNSDAEVLVFEPRGSGGFTYIGRVTLEEWPGLVAEIAPPPPAGALDGGAP